VKATPIAGACDFDGVLDCPLDDDVRQEISSSGATTRTVSQYQARPLARAALRTGGDGFVEIENILVAVAHQLAMVGMHHVHGRAQHHQHAGVGAHLLDACRCDFRNEVVGRRIAAPDRVFAAAVQGEIFVAVLDRISRGDFELWTKMVRFLGAPERVLIVRKKNLRLPAQIFVKRCRAALWRPDDEEIRDRGCHVAFPTFTR